MAGADDQIILVAGSQSHRDPMVIYRWLNVVCIWSPDALRRQYRVDQGNHGSAAMRWSMFRQMDASSGSPPGAACGTH